MEGEEIIGTKGPELDLSCYTGDRTCWIALQEQNSPGNKEGVITFWNQPDVGAFTLHPGVWIYYKQSGVSARSQAPKWQTGWLEHTPSHSSPSALLHQPLSGSRALTRLIIGNAFLYDFI